MNKDPSILIVYSTFGDGHYQVANALKQSFAAQGYHKIHLVDLFAETHPFWNAISRFTYLKSALYFPKLYGMSYHWMNISKPEARIYKWLHGLGKRKVVELVQRIKPDAVIHTFPFLAVPQLNDNGDLAVPTFTVLTDYVSHNRWIHPGTDRYFVATNELKSELVKRGVNDSRISVTGIPVRKSFRMPVNKAALRQKYGLESGKNYLLLVAGAYGVLSNVRQVLQTVLERTGYEVLLVCGKNEKLAHRMIDAYSGDKRVRVFGFVEGMEELMSISSCLVTKAGAITLTEASALSLPVVVYRPLPGQEEGNADTLSKKGSVLVARTTEQLARHLLQLEEETFRVGMGSAIHDIHVADTGSYIVSEVLQYTEQFQRIRQWVPSTEERQAVHGFR
ncbi:glycosyltransferase [Cohnella endophytica]|uniref:Glycosyltransferase n=1 Tax=Cohnella endophytica TaxID=2419778 RepID=A0A494Y685_9BACL|nr:glycosyltransferase [Cohnella endophytica]RKP58179.1 glycosyltransferase [Cohnella endophytica]